MITSQLSTLNIDTLIALSLISSGTRWTGATLMRAQLWRSCRCAEIELKYTHLKDRTSLRTYTKRQKELTLHRKLSLAVTIKLAVNNWRSTIPLVASQQLSNGQLMKKDSVSQGV